MNQIKKIITDTQHQQAGGSSVVKIEAALNRQTYTANEAEYTELPRTVAVEVGTQLGAINDVRFKEGDLFLTVRERINRIDYHVDEQGSLFVNAEDADRYYIDEEGNLKYDFSILYNVV